MVGARRFKLRAFRSQSGRAIRLRYAPRIGASERTRTSEGHDAQGIYRPLPLPLGCTLTLIVMVQMAGFEPASLRPSTVGVFLIAPHPHVVKGRGLEPPRPSRQYHLNTEKVDRHKGPYQNPLNCTGGFGTAPNQQLERLSARPLRVPFHWWIRREFNPVLLYAKQECHASTLRTHDGGADGD